ncbi:MAG: M56 family metallopeptidase [Rhodanobacteraceae bacterium]
MNAWSAAMDVVQVLGWALVHFVWQAALIGALYALLRRCLPRGEARYLLGMLALLALALCPVLTAWHMAGAMFASGETDVGAVAAVFGTAMGQGSANAAASWQAALSAALPWLVLAWSCGVGLLSLRMWRHWRRLRALVRASEAVPVWQERLRALAQRFGLRRGIRVLASARVATPTLVGWIRPVILLPLAVSSGFPLEQVELILAHELAHMRRLDHFANLFQVVLETLLFYHPVVHWISRDVRNERELCCDALALRVTGGSRREFATALVELEEFRGQHAGLALAASGGVLLERIGEITRPERQSAVAHQPGRFVGAVSVLLLAGLLSSLLWRQAELQRDSSAAADMQQQLLASQLLPASVRMPMQTIANLVPRHFTTAWSSLPVQSSPSTSVALAAPVRGAPDKLAVAAIGLRIADLNPSRLALAPAAVPQHAVSAPEVSQVLAPTRIEQPIYPLGALEQGIEGKVVIEFSLNPDGTVRDPAVVAAQPAGVFDNAATRALLGWKFAQPAVDSSRRYRQTFTFTLHPRSDSAGREIEARAGCHVVTGSHICRPRSPEEAFGNGPLP